ncbi:MAG: septum formation initiator family protein [Pseudomonadota bacterium]|nr:septum formation initiator family protein [Pseudomonadota bacterium]
MAGKQHIGLIRRAMGPALALVVIGTFAGHAIAGPNGLFAWGGYHRDLGERQAELAKLDATLAQLRHRSALLDPRKADPDMADELVRRDLGLVRADEVILPL